MNALRRSVAAKATSVILSYFAVAIAVISAIAIGVMVNNDFYTCDFDTLEERIMGDLADDEMYTVFSHFYYSGNIDEYYTGKNVCVEISDSYGTVLYSNLNLADDEYTAVRNATFYDREYEKYIADNSEDFSEEENIHFYSAEKDIGGIINVKIGIPLLRDMKYTDRFYLIDRMIVTGFSLRYALIAALAVSFTASVILVVFLFSAAGYRKNAEGPVTNMIDRFPIDVRLAFVVLCFSILVSSVDWGYNDWKIATALLFLFASVMYFLVLGLFLSMATLLKTSGLIKNTLTYKTVSFIIRKLKKCLIWLKSICVRLPVIWKTVLLLFFCFFLEFISIMAFGGEIDNMLIFWLFKNIAVAIVVFLYAGSFSRIKDASVGIANGVMDTRIDTRFMVGDIREVGQNLNNISNGLNTAVNDKMHSERLKTELITNVSHDIKTPLTSIINYVDLLSREELNNEKAAEYLAVLDRQSKRLKKLTDDLVEASKASTGNLTVELAPCDVRVLVSQAVGEYDERFAENGLTAVCSLSEETLIISADGRRLWRVFDNLLNNICKYAQGSTRVYIDAEKEADKVKIVFKNISKFPLNFSGSELMERFVRGDRSRNTEGSGLGLSIAKSLTELQGGKLDIIIDGDLFKAEITFDAVLGDAV